MTRALGASEFRTEAIENAVDQFDHSSESGHNLELHHGAAAALYKLWIVSKSSSERSQILFGLEKVLRGSPKHVVTAYPKLDGLVEKLLQYELTELSAKVIYNLSRPSELRAGLLEQHPTLLSSLSDLDGVPTDARVVRVKALVNLCKESQVQVYETAGLLDNVLRMAHLDESAVVRQYTGQLLMELSTKNTTMALNANVLGTTVKMILMEKSSSTRESAITCLQNLAFTKENRKLLIDFKNGIVLEALKKTLSTDPDPKARRRAAGALTNLACDETAEALGNYKNLLQTLAIVATKDNELDVQTRASLALTKIASSITHTMNCHPELLDALVVTSLSKSENSVAAVLRVKARNADCRKVLARHPGVVDTLSDICLSDRSSVADRDNAIRAIMHLVNEEGNRKLLCNKTVLTAIVAAALYEDVPDGRDSAIRAMERLATEASNRSAMAHHENLLVAVAAAVEREARLEDAGKTHEFLAKPLLMSLLITM